VGAVGKLAAPLWPIADRSCPLATVRAFSTSTTTIRWLAGVMILFLLACASRVQPGHPPSSPPPAVECARSSPDTVDLEEAFLRAFMGIGESEGVDCTWRGALPPPYASVRGERFSQRSWSSIDSSETWIRFEGVEDADLDALVEEEGWALKRGSVADLDPFFPVHPDATQEHRGDEPDWFAGLDDLADGELVWSHFPANIEDCRYIRGKGRLAVRVGDVVQVYAWNYQHFFPDGGCGG